MNFHTNASLLDAEQYKIYEFKENKSATVPGYLVVSTATLNVEQENYIEHLQKPTNPQFFIPSAEQDETSTKGIIDKIARYLIESHEPEIVINIHGYSSTPYDTEKGCKKIYDYVNRNIEQKNKYLFIGYRWPSENPIKKDQSGTFQEKLGYALNALPILLAGILSIGLVISIVTTLIFLFFNPLPSGIVHFFTALLIPSGIATSAMITLILLRISAYFRDVYRASNYGIIDLVELLRQIDFTVHREVKDKRIKLSFIGHSMGCFVVTHVIRILSDIFDVQSINKIPSSNIGNVFCLGQLVLVAPDIPVETILPGRANFLRSSLRRCQEAYIFCNEGDLALRVTSTAANYFSFPAKTRISGYRLGNVTVSHFTNQNDKVGYTPKYGIVNLVREDNADRYTCDRPYKYLEIRSSNREHRKLEEMRKFLETELQPADLFTYFDCTDYKNDKSQDIGIVSLAIQKPAINFWDYVSLTFAFTSKASKNESSKGVDTHSGYFQGEFSQQAIYTLAFLGFQGFLNSLLTQERGEEQIRAFSQECHNKQIQVILAPHLYQNTL
ncbi:alpha/beta hydrolase [Scytonema sp. UIC 10036]|uniref:alpha/beta hydrolase n=1 Tax=Scytonema sp. UIC 10036 TaxID=2304196 RepID=UPI0012DA32A7|nr:alpha/beta hydrolase [Scytonema sp. UIC 10036]MUH01215.1 alpha/beta hydrolase [Scytonema sp. UIC 10036]